MLLKVVSPQRKGSKKSRKKHTQSQLSIGRKSNRLIITMPTGDKTSGDSSSPQARKSPMRKELKKARSPSPTIVIDSDDSVPTTHSGKKRKLSSQPEEDLTKKKAKMTNPSAKKSNGSKTGCAKQSAKKTELYFL